MLPIAVIWGLTFTQLAIYVVGFAAIAAIVVVVLKRMGISPPDWFVNILWILLAAFVGIVAILIVASMMRG